jgi:zeaxanthin glucosyltransferase
VLDLNSDLTRVAFDYLADKLTTTGVEALVIDTVHFFIELVPLNMSMPAYTLFFTSISRE